jgi:queuosine precursor transporter
MRANRNRVPLGLLMSASLIGTVALSNWLTARFGFIPVGFGLSAAAGTLAAGAALSLRDAVQDLIGRWMSVAAIAIGAMASFTVARRGLAVASASAFAIGELVDLAIYTPIRVRARFGHALWVFAVMVAGVVGAIADTCVFLGLAFGWHALPHTLTGQLVGKTWALLSYAVIGKAVVAGAVLRQSDRQPEGA